MAALGSLPYLSSEDNAKEPASKRPRYGGEMPSVDPSVMFRKDHNDYITQGFIVKPFETDEINLMPHHIGEGDIALGLFIENQAEHNKALLQKDYIFNFQQAQYLCVQQFNSLRDRINAKWANAPNARQRIFDSTGGAEIVGDNPTEDVFAAIVNFVYEPLLRPYTDRSEWLSRCEQYKSRLDTLVKDAHVGNVSWMWVFPELLMKYLKPLGIVMDASGKIMGSGVNMHVPMSVYLMGECEAKNIFGRQAYVHQMLVITYEKPSIVSPFKLGIVSSQEFITKFGQRLERDLARAPIVFEMTDLAKKIREGIDYITVRKDSTDPVVKKQADDARKILGEHEARHTQLNKQLEEINGQGPYEFGLMSTLGKPTAGPAMMSYSRTDENLLQNNEQKKDVIDVIKVVKKQRKVKFLVTVRPWL
jgi:hypothetical protein